MGQPRSAVLVEPQPMWLTTVWKTHEVWVHVRLKSQWDGEMEEEGLLRDHGLRGRFLCLSSKYKHLLSIRTERNRKGGKKAEKPGQELDCIVTTETQYFEETGCEQDLLEGERNEPRL